MPGPGPVTSPFKRVIGPAAGRALLAAPASLRRRLRRKRTTILVYHQIAPALFAAHLDFLAARYTIIPLRLFAAAVQNGSDDALPPDPLVITFDDAWQSNYALLPVLRAHTAPVTVFVPTGLVNTNRRIWNYTLEDRKGRNRALNTHLKALDNHARLDALRARTGHYPEREYDTRVFLNLTEIREMQDLVDFQSHGVFHPVLPTCSDAEIREELGASKDFLETRLGGECYALAYPYGRNGPRERRLAREAGYIIARSINQPGLNAVDDDPFALKGLA